MRPLLPVAVLMCWVSCTQTTSPGTGSPLTKIEFVQGEVFRYAVTVTIEDSAGNSELFSSDTASLTVVDIAAELPGYSGLIELRASMALTGLVIETTVWYLHSDSGLVEIAYRNAGGAPVYPKVTPFADPRFSAGFRGISISALPLLLPLPVGEGIPIADSILFREEPRWVFQYPLTVGSSWVSFHTPFLQNREVVGLDWYDIGNRSVYGAGILTTIPELAPEMTWIDVVDTHGVALRTIDMPAILTTEENPDGEEYVIVKQRCERLP